MEKASDGFNMSQIVNPLKGRTEYGWHFEQNVYTVGSIVRAIKSGEGSGNIPKVIEESYEDGQINSGRIDAE